MKYKVYIGINSSLKKIDLFVSSDFMFKKMERLQSVKQANEKLEKQA